MTNQILNPAQIETVKSFFMACAFFRKEDYIHPRDDLLEAMTSLYCRIFETGNDPIRLAAIRVFGKQAYKDYLYDGGTLPPSTQ